MYTNLFMPGSMLRVRKNGNFVGRVFVVTTAGMQEILTGKPVNGLDPATLVKVGSAPEHAAGVCGRLDPLSHGV